MGINDLKAKAYELAGVSNTQKLKARYRPIGELNLRLKSSWQQVVALLEAGLQTTPANSISISDLKAEVYDLAQVVQTGELKAKYPSLSSLNFSFKSSWETALNLLQADRPDFQNWLKNPPEEYRDLFKDIESVSAEFGHKVEKAKHLGEDALAMAKSLEQLAEEAQAEAEHLRQEAETAARVARRANLN
jgi:hypothetical protein